MTLTAAGFWIFWIAVVIVALGAAMVVRTSRRDPSAPPFDRVFALTVVAVAAGIVGLVSTMALPPSSGSVGDRLSALAETVEHSSAMLGAIVGAALGWCYALAYVLVSGTRVYWSQEPALDRGPSWPGSRMRRDQRSAAAWHRRMCLRHLMQRSGRCSWRNRSGGPRSRGTGRRS